MYFSPSTCNHSSNLTLALIKVCFRKTQVFHMIYSTKMALILNISTVKCLDQPAYQCSLLKLFSHCCHIPLWSGSLLPASAVRAIYPFDHCVHKSNLRLSIFFFQRTQPASDNTVFMNQVSCILFVSISLTDQRKVESYVSRQIKHPLKYTVIKV